jgi:hypothetical protein
VQRSALMALANLALEDDGQKKLNEVRACGVRGCVMCVRERVSEWVGVKLV